MFHARMCQTIPLLRGCASLLNELLQFVLRRMTGTSDVHENDLKAVAADVLQLSQVNYLGAENVSGKAA